MTPLTIYTSPWPSVSIDQESIFTHIFKSTEKDHHLAYIDAASGQKLTKRDVRDRALALAHGLLYEVYKNGPIAQLKRGDTIMVLSQNHFLFPIWIFAAFAAGLRVTLASSNSSPKELLHQWKDGNPRCIVASSSLAPVALKTLGMAGFRSEDAAKRIVVFADGVSTEPLPPLPFIPYQHIAEKGRLKEEEKFLGEQADETVLICYSSGTSGLPKGVEISHKAIVSTMNIIPSMVDPQDKPRVLLNPSPFYHIYGVIAGLILPLSEGITSIIMAKFDIVDFFRHIQTYRVEYIYVVPAIAHRFLDHPLVDDYDLTSLKSMACGASVLAASVVTGLHQKYSSPKQQLRVTQGYGLTEIAGGAIILASGEGSEDIGPTGSLVPNMEARLVDDDGNDVPRGESATGELWLRGPSVTKGYLNNEAATRETITSDGWLKTGDIFTRNSEGLFRIVDRKKELIKYKGYQVPPAELEGTLLKHPEVADSAVVGVVVNDLELPRGYITLKKPTTDVVTQKRIALEVQEWIKGEVGYLKYLRGGVVVVSEIPRNPTGKILRRILKERASKEVAAETKLKSKL